MTTQTRRPSDPASVSQVTYLDALVQAQLEEMERDERVIYMGEDPAVYGSLKLLEQFGPSRVLSTPISEGSYTGVAIGAAITGLRPIVELPIASFVYLAADQIINQASKLRYMTGGQVSVPILFRTTMYYGVGNAAQHSDRPYAAFMNVPGLKVIAPTTPADVRGLVKSAIRADDPVFLFDDINLWTVRGIIPTDPDELVPIGKARVVVEGSDVTVVAVAGAITAAAEAASRAASEGVAVELIDVRTLKPLDIETIVRSVTKTGRLLVVENGHLIAGAGAEIAAIAAEQCFSSLKSRVVRLAAAEVPVPFSPPLESVLYPRTDDVVQEINAFFD